MKTTYSVLQFVCWAYLVAGASRYMYLADTFHIPLESQLPGFLVLFFLPASFMAVLLQLLKK